MAAATGRPDTRAARSAIFASLRRDAATDLPPLPDLAPFFSGAFGRGGGGSRIDPAALIEPFETAARGWRADVLRARLDDWPGAVRSALEARRCMRVAIGTRGALQPALRSALQGVQVRRFEQPLTQWKSELFDAIDAGITGALAGIADTGTLLLRPDAHEPRTLSLVPPVHVAVLMCSTLHASLAAAWRALALAADMPTNLLLVSGPSKTADIQQTLAYGAHGPKELVIVLVDDLASGGGAP